jgi:hypothetical protein
MTYKTEAERRDEAPSRGELAYAEACDTAAERTWWTDHTNLMITAAFLLEPEQILDMLEHPWRYTGEFVHAVEREASEDERPVDSVLAERLGAPRMTVLIPNEDEPLPVVALIDDEVTFFFAHVVTDEAYVDEDADRGDR